MNLFNFNVEIDKEHVRDNGEYDFGWIELRVFNIYNWETGT